VMDVLFPELIHHNFPFPSQKVSIAYNIVCLYDTYLQNSLLLFFFLLVLSSKVLHITDISSFLFAVDTLLRIFLDSKRF
jgi:hypothetical protein